MSNIVEEVAAAISINDVNYAVMMITPDDIEDFIVGFLFTESLIEQIYDLHDIEIESQPLGLCISVKLSNRSLYKLAERKRSLKGTAGCGLCGSQALEHAFPQLKPLDSVVRYKIQHSSDLKQSLQQHQTKAKNSGALHAAFWLDQNNNIISCREDIGRHNALDKIIGVLKSAKYSERSLTKDALLITSRCSAELIQKTVKARVPTLISLASPSSLALNLANQYNLNLIHVPKRDDAIYYPADEQFSKVNGKL